MKQKTKYERVGNVLKPTTFKKPKKLDDTTILAWIGLGIIWLFIIMTCIIIR